MEINGASNIQSNNLGNGLRNRKTMEEQ